MTAIGLLSWCAVLLTVVGSYRLTTYFYRRDPLYAGVAAAAMTLCVVAFFSSVLLITGLVVLLLPVYLLATRETDDDGRRDDYVIEVGDGGGQDYVGGAIRRGRNLGGQVRDGVADVVASGRALVASEEGAPQCPLCDERLDTAVRRCPNCGLSLNTPRRTK